MRKNRKSSSHTHRNRIYITAFLLAGSFILGGCIIKKAKEADSKLPEIVIGIDYFEPYSYLPKVMMGGRKGGSVACTWAMPVKLSHGSADMGQQLAGLPGLARTPLISL